MTDPSTPDPGTPDPTIAWALADDPPAKALRSDSKRNRDAVVDAVLELHADGNLRPSSNEIAERAAISPRSVFRYFTDVDDLARAAISRQLERIRPLLVIDVADGASVAARSEALAVSRGRAFQAMGPSGTVARLRAPFQPVIAAQLTQARRFFRQQIERLFAPELAAMPDHLAVAILAAADVLCSFESYQLLRVDQRLSEDQAVVALAEALVRLIG